MRARSLKPGFFQNEHLAALSPHARLLFAGLWCIADREGRMEDRPQRIKASIFPYESIDIEALLTELATSSGNFIIRYQTDENHFIQVVNFRRHQTPHIKECASTIPAPYQHQTTNKPKASTVLARCKSHTSTVQTPDEHPRNPIPDSPFPISHSGQLITDSRDPAPAGENSSVSVSVSQSDIDDVKEICKLNLITGLPEDEVIKAAINEYTKAWIVEAVKEACRSNNLTWDYLLGILRNCRAESHSPGAARSAPPSSCAGCVRHHPAKAGKPERCALGKSPCVKCEDYSPSRAQKVQR